MFNDIKEPEINLMSEEDIKLNKEVEDMMNYVKSIAEKQKDDIEFINDVKELVEQFNKGE